MKNDKNKNKVLSQTSVVSGADDKGVLNGKCNITSCQKPNSATWYNHSTKKTLLSILRKKIKQR